MQLRLRVKVYIILTILILFSGMTNAADGTVGLKEKIGQMLIIGFKGTEVHRNDAIVKDILAS